MEVELPCGWLSSVGGRRMAGYDSQRSDAAEHEADCGGFDSQAVYPDGPPKFRNVAVSHYGFEQTMRRLLKSDEDMLFAALGLIREIRLPTVSFTIWRVRTALR